MSSSYPKVHVVGSGAYYSYRPITRNIEKVTRNHIRDCSSRPKEFSLYVAANNSRGDGYKRAVSTARDFGRGSSLPPFDTTERKRTSDKGDDSFFRRGGEDSFSKAGGDDSFSRRGGGDDILSKYGIDDSFSKRGAENSFMRRKADNTSSTSSKRRAKSVYLNQEEDYSTSRAAADSFVSSGDDTLTRLRRKHPFRLAVENEHTAPHESSIWPENRPHFDLVSSYDVMVDYLGIRDKSKK